MYDKAIYFLMLFFLSIFLNELDAKESLFSLGIWDFNNINGSIGIEGNYRQQKDILNDKGEESIRSTLYKARLNLRTDSYIWHPNFMTMNVNLEYNPYINKDRSLIVPQRTESNTSEGVYASTTLFSSLPLTFNLNGNYVHSYTSRDYATDLELNQRNLGGSVFLKNSLMPINVSYLDSKWTQNELKISRLYTYKEKTITANSKLDIGEFSQNHFDYNFNDLTTLYDGNLPLNTKINHASISNSLLFDKENKNSVNSNFSYYHSYGNLDLNRIDETAMLKLTLPERFTLKADYNYNNITTYGINSIQHSPQLRLENQLYSSLNSYGYFLYNNFNSMLLTEIRKATAIGFRYSKIIPSGMLYINNELNYLNENSQSKNSQVVVNGETITLEDGRISILKNPYITEESITVHDASNTVIYSRDLDYIIIRRGSYIEIQRIPGGRIENGITVYVDYNSSSQGTYKYDAITNNFDIRLVLFERIFEVYFKYLLNDYSNIETSEAKILKNINQKQAGFQINVGSFNFGTEFDYYETNILPYHAYRIFSRYNSNITNNIVMSFTGNYHSQLFTEQGERQLFIDFAGKTDYLYAENLTFSIEGAYKYQEGNGLGLNLLDFKFETKYQIKRIFITFGYHGFFRNFVGATTNYNGLNIKLERRF